MLPNPFPSTYRIGEDGVTLCTSFAPQKDLTYFNDETNNCQRTVRRHDRYLNRGIRRELCYLFSGDSPVFGFGLAQKVYDNQAPLLNMGEFTFSLVENGTQLPLTQTAHITAEHFPNGTRWVIEPVEGDERHIMLEAELLPKNSIAVTLYTEGTNADTEFCLSIGKQRRAGRTIDASWFNAESTPLSCTVEPGPEACADAAFYVAAGEPYNEKALLTFWGELSSADYSGDDICIRFSVKPDTCFAAQALLADEGQAVDMALCYPGMEALCRAGEAENQRVNERLSRIRLESGDPYLSCGFLNSVLNLDYCHVGRGWLESAQWWCCYWTNNYQISAAMALGDWDLARDALHFFGSIPEGYNSIAPTGKPLEIRCTEEGEPVRPYDGMPYYLHQLHEYIEAKGQDGLSLLNEVFDNIHQNLLSMMHHCDPDGSGLYGFHKGCNPFLYQADHLAIPGEGISPSIMMAWGFRHLADDLSKLGKTEYADFYRKAANKTFGRIGELWDDNGYYLSEIDIAGDPNRAHYYTDLVFPVLYSDVPIVNKTLSLLHLLDSLVHRSEATGLCLMQVGEFLPSLFANDNIMPVQLSEAAIALFRMGQCQVAWELLRSCGLAFSVYTESPGSAPERFGINGRGEANYVFGNPSAAFPYAVIAGLFGIRYQNNGKTLRYAPAYLPDENLSLTQDGVVFTAENNRYTMTGAGGWESVEFSVCVPAGSMPVLYCNGESVAYETQPLLNCRRITAAVLAQPSLVWEIEIEKTADCTLPPIVRQPGELLGLADMAPGQASAFSLPGLHHVLLERDGYLLDQPVNVIPALSSASATLRDRELLICGTIDPREDVRVTFAIAGESFSRSLSADADGCFACRLKLASRLLLPAYSVHYLLQTGSRQESGVIRAVNQTNIDFSGYPLDLQAFFNADTVNGDSPWRLWYPVELRFSDDACAGTHCAYHLVKNEQDACRVCRLEKGKSKEGKREIASTGYPAAAQLPVNKSVGAVSLLYAADVDVRLVQETVGAVILEYTDGETVSVPLSCGSNVGSLFRNFAQDTVHVPALTHTNRDSVNHYAIPCDEDKTLRCVRIEITKEDVRFALLATNLYGTLPEIWSE